MANLRVLETEEVKSAAHVPVLRSFIERLIGTVRREYIDRVLFWNAVDLAPASSSRSRCLGNESAPQ